LGPAFIRLLARFGDAAVPPTPPVLTERLAQWFDWNRALALSHALDGSLPATAAGAADSGGDSDDAQGAECARVRHALLQVIEADIDLAPPSHESADADYLPYRQHCMAAQRAMQAATGLLRGRLRDLLARQSPAKARLAEVDAVMEATLSPRELMLLARVPGLLGLHYRRLRDAGASRHAGADAPDDIPATLAAGPWLARFRQDMRMALLAELEVRFHPIDGLLAALRSR
jgi:hypothetical protein